MTQFGQVNTSTVLNRQRPLVLKNFRVGVAAPKSETIGFNPSVPVWRFDNVNRLINTDIAIPRDMDVSVDPRLALQWCLVNSQVDGDETHWACDYVVCQNAIPGQGPAKTSTSTLNDLTVTTTSGLSVGDMYTTTFTLDRNDTDNPINVNSVLVCAEFRLFSLTGVAAVDLVNSDFLYEAKV